MEISDCSGYRVEPGVVDVRFKQRRRPVWRAAEVGGNIDPEIIKRTNKIESPATQVYAVVEVRKLCIWVRVPTSNCTNPPMASDSRPSEVAMVGRPSGMLTLTP